MKKLLLMFAAVATLFTACDKNEPEHIYDDHSGDLVGTWTCLTENYAEALIISADGTAVSYGVENGEYWENVKGKVVTNGNNITMNFEDDDNLTGHFDIIPGIAFSLFEDSGERYVYQYCANGLSDEIIGMWVCNETPSAEENDMLIMTYNAEGTTLFTGYSYEADVFSNNVEASYKVIGDLLIHKQPDIAVEYGLAQYNAMRIKYIPNGTALGDVKTLQAYAKVGENYVETNTTFLRIKQNLELANKSYDYNNVYVTNVKAKDAEFEFAGQTLNLANMDGRILDKMMKTLLFNVSFPSSDEIVYNYHYNGQNIPMPAPIVVDGNKMTIKKSANNPACKDIDVWTFQDQDNTQMHMYMSVTSFENFLANTAVEMLANDGKLDLNDAAAVKAIFDEVEAAIETINVSFIFKTAK